MNMTNTLIYVLRIIGLVIFVYIIYALLKKYFFSKFKVNKWIIIGLILAVFAVPLILSSVLVFKMNIIISTIQSGVLVILFLWFMDTMGWGPKTAPSKTKLKTNKTKYATTTVIKSKAKPNRLKNTDMEVIDIKDIKRKKKK